VRRHPLRTSVTIALLATAGMVVAAGGSAVPGSAAARPAARTPAATGAGGAARRILMINGDRLLAVSAAGGPRVLGILPGAAGPAGRLIGLGLGGTALEIPAVALPYLGRGLAPGLFEPSALARAEAGGRLPLTVSYQGKIPALPGVTITGAGGGTASGYLTATGAAAFGAALARQFAADHGTDSYGRDGMFAGGVSVGLPGGRAGAARAALAPRQAPGFRMHTLTVTGTDLAGRPDTGDLVFVFDADNAQRYDDPAESIGEFDHGVVRFSVPAGHLWALGIFMPVAHGKPAATRTVVVPQIDASRNVTVHMAARAADSEVRMVTARPSVPNPFSLHVEIRHPTPAGPVGYLWYLGGPLYFTPTTRRPTVGTLQMYVNEELDSPRQAAGMPYQYDVAYGYTSGLIGSQRHVVRQAGLATVHASYYSDVPTTGYFSRFGVFAPQWKEVSAVLFEPMRVPRRETEYLTGNPAVLWADSYQQSFQNLAGGQTDDLRTFRAGQRLTENWNAYPLHAGYNTNLIGAANVAAALPSASRAGNALTLDVMPFSDSTPGHVGGSGFFGGAVAPYGKISGHYLIAENGRTIAAGNPLAHDQAVGPAGEFHTRVTLSPHPATVRLVLDATRKAKIYLLSTVSRTVWTWRSVPRRGARLPAGWGCVLQAFGTVTGRSCAVEPMMTLEYAVTGLSLTGTAPAGAQVVRISAGHLQLAKAAAVTGAKVAVSFDAGKTWHRAAVTGSAGSYTAAFTAPPGATVSLRTSAADAAGGTVTETLLGAYQVK
jgi:hypothetical protein